MVDLVAVAVGGDSGAAKVLVHPLRVGGDVEVEEIQAWRRKSMKREFHLSSECMCVAFLNKQSTSKTLPKKTPEQGNHINGIQPRNT